MYQNRVAALSSECAVMLLSNDASAVVKCCGITSDGGVLMSGFGNWPFSQTTGENFTLSFFIFNLCLPLTSSLSDCSTEIDVAFPEDPQPQYHHVLELRHTRVIWRNCLILAFTLFIGTGIQYCFTRNIHLYSSQFYFGYFLRTVTEALACVFLCVLVDRVGRRGILLLTAIVTGLSSLLLLALTQYLHGGLVLVLSVVGLLASQALAMLSVFFASEVMPTVVRGGALGLVMAAGSVGMAASSLMELQNNGGYFLHHVVFASFAVLSVLCIMLLPESKRKALPDSLKDGENLRRPPLFLSRGERDSLPLLRTRQPASDNGNAGETLRSQNCTDRPIFFKTIYRTCCSESGRMSFLHNSVSGFTVFCFKQTFHFN
uniref:Solute carrier family 22 member 31 n=1 Tax=Astyanax mexicanus TaxID=7994 RepID=A0A8B9JCF6_ASTMX